MDYSYKSGGETGYKFLTTDYNNNGKYADFESNITLGKSSCTNNTGDGALPLALDLG